MMRTGSRSTRKSLPQINHRGHELCKEAEKVFVQTNEPDKKLGALQVLEKSRFWRSSSNLATIGAMLIELSGSQAYSPDDRIDFVSRASEYLEKATATNPNGRSQSIFRARQLLANISIFKFAAVDLPPSREAVDTAMSKTIEISKQALSDEFYLKRRDNNESAIKQVKGAQAELVPLLLLQRFEQRELGDLSWLALPSNHSEDNTTSSGGILRSWDISGYTSSGDNEPYELTYPIQVKGYRDNNSKRLYDESIILLHVAQDLSIKPNNGSRRNPFPCNAMLDHIIREYEGDTSLSASLDKRTEQLLEILG